MKIAAISILLTLWCGCGKQPMYYRVDVNSGYALWRETRPTTFHGICASAIGSKTGWEVDHPYGHVPTPDGSGLIGSPYIDIREFKTKGEAYAWAESVCPTKLRSKEQTGEEG